MISRIILGLCLNYIISSPVLSQTLPPVRSPDTDNLPSRQELPTLNEINPLPIPSIVEQDAFDPDFMVTVGSIEFSGNEVLSNEDIEAVISPFIGATLNIRELGKIERAISDLYKEKKYIGSGAFIFDNSQPFEIDNAVIQIKIIERKITTIAINAESTESKRLKPYLKKSLKNLIGKPLNEGDLSNELRFLLKEPSIGSIKIDIEPTEFIDEASLSLDVSAGDIVTGTVLLNNERSPATGNIERGFNLTHRNVSGLGDQISIDYRNTNGSNIAGFNYKIPINSSDGTFSLNYLFGDSLVTQEPLNQLDLRSRTHTIGASFQQPVIRSSSNKHLQELVLGFGVSRYDNQDSVLGISFPLSDSASINGATRSLIINTFQEFSSQTQSDSLRVKSDLSYGIPAGTSNDDFFGNGEFIKYRIAGEYTHKFSDIIETSSRISGQITDRNVVLNENFFIGGSSSVRAFRPAAIARNNGISLSQELKFTIFEQSDHRLELAPFFDFGIASNLSEQTFESTETLASTGFNIRYHLLERIFASFEFAQAILGNRNSRGSQINFNFQWRIF